MKDSDNDSERESNVWYAYIHRSHNDRGASLAIDTWLYIEYKLWEKLYSPDASLVTYDQVPIMHPV